MVYLMEIYVYMCNISIFEIWLYRPLAPKPELDTQPN